jgi:putative endonuclease
MASRVFWFRGARRVANAIAHFATRRLARVPLGMRGERIAARYLRRLGYKIVASRARDRLGEIDLVCVDGRTVVFVEVKTRRSSHSGDPAEAVDEKKQRRLTRVALSFLRRHDLLDQAVRFDVVAIIWPKGASQPSIQHLEGAFQPTDRWQMHA